MNGKQKLFAAGSTAFMLALSAAAAAQDSGFYAGAAIARADYQLHPGCNPAVVCEDKDTSWKLFGGYQVNKNIGAEVGIGDLGEIKSSALILGAPLAVTLKTKVYELLGVGTVPINDKFAAYGKLGVFRWETDASGAGAGPGMVPSSLKGTDFTFGLGLKYDFNRSLAARVEWQRYNNIGDNTQLGGHADVNFYSLGFAFKF